MYYVYLIIFPQKLKHKHAVDTVQRQLVTFQLEANFDLAHSSVDPGFLTQRNHSHHSHFACIVTIAPPSFEQKPKSEWRSLWDADNLTISDFEGRKGVNLALAILIYFYGIFLAVESLTPC